MAAIHGKWYAASNGHDAYPADPETVRFVYATQPDGERYIVAKVWADGDDFESNARLVAAAPQLLAACKRMMGLIQDIDRALGRNPGLIFDAMAAIQQAEGVKRWPRK